MSKYKEKDDYPRAVAHRIDGQMVLDDPDAVDMINAGW